MGAAPQLIKFCKETGNPDSSTIINQRSPITTPSLRNNTDIILHDIRIITDADTMETTYIYDGTQDIAVDS